MKRKAHDGEDRWGNEPFEDAEAEASKALLLLRYKAYFRSCLPHWGGLKRPRSGLSGKKTEPSVSPSSPFHLHSSESDQPCNSESRQPLPDSDKKNEDDLLPAKTKKSNKKNVPQRRRAPRKLTYSEWREKEDILLLEKQELTEQLEEIRKSREDLRKENTLLKSEMSSHLERLGSQQQNLQPSSAETVQEIPAPLSDLQRIKNHESTDKTVNIFSSLSGHQNGTSTSYYQDCQRSAMANPSPGFIDLNAPPREGLLDSLQNDIEGEMQLPTRKAILAAEARKRRIELTRLKSLQSNRMRQR
eukprot:TRINITY_DN5225_c0_g1_i1.p1 TRINITY_DN5225_c0_g1~~TRINITY_DN5225_c0_g1_i1.p1  ORF type:complete len:302 (+),score=59.40 TRINITY_DN5225_c0_g1_i1:63-968(+)